MKKTREDKIMGKKLILVRYLGFSSDKEFYTVGKLYAYMVNTRKSIRKNDFVVLADITQNDDRNVVSTVRVIQVLDDNATSEEVDKALDTCAYDKPRYKIFVGKADLGDYFAEIDKKKKIAELQNKLEERFKEAEKEALYRKLAETDPEMKSLLAELDALK